MSSRRRFGSSAITIGSRKGGIERDWVIGQAIVQCWAACLGRAMSSEGRLLVWGHEFLPQIVVLFSFKWDMGLMYHFSRTIEEVRYMKDDGQHGVLQHQRSFSIPRGYRHLAYFLNFLTMSQVIYCLPTKDNICRRHRHPSAY